jgi:hypothetical protein
MNNNLIIKTCITIDIIYQRINIKKALIICDFINQDISLFISKLEEYNHNVATYENINTFLNCKKRLLILSLKEFKKSLNKIILDEHIDTIFLSNISLERNIINKFNSKIIIYNV